MMEYAPKHNQNVLNDYYEVSFRPRGKSGAIVDLHRSLIHPDIFKLDEDLI
jgi:hypothetical protein